MRVAVTGASGFIGSRLIRALADRGLEVRAGTRRTLALPAAIDVVCHGDLRDQVDWQPFVTGVDVVVHAAGIAHTTGVTESDHDRVNHLQTAALAEAARRAGVARFVLISSLRAQVGPCAPGPVSEQDEPRPVDAYGRSKLAAEAAVRASKLPHVILRPALVHGPGVKGNLAWLKRLARLPGPLPLGALDNRRSLCALDGLIDAIELALTVGAGVFVVADARPIAVRDIVSTLRAAIGRRPGLYPVPRVALAGALRLVGRADLWERLGGELIAAPSRLVDHGWQPRDSAPGLARL